MHIRRYVSHWHTQTRKHRFKHTDSCILKCLTIKAEQWTGMSLMHVFHYLTQYFKYICWPETCLWLKLIIQRKMQRQNILFLFLHDMWMTILVKQMQQRRKLNVLPSINWLQAKNTQYPEMIWSKSIQSNISLDQEFQMLENSQIPYVSSFKFKEQRRWPGTECQTESYMHERERGNKSFQALSCSQTRWKWGKW